MLFLISPTQLIKTPPREHYQYVNKSIKVYQSNNQSMSFYNSFMDSLANRPDSRIFTLVGPNGREVTNLTYRSLHLRAQRVGNTLTESKGLKKGDNVLLFYPPGIDFIVAFLACMWKGIIPVPVATFNPLYPNEWLETVTKIAADCEAKVILTDYKMMNMKRLGSVKTFFTRNQPQWPDLPWIETESMSACGDVSFDVPVTVADDTAFIQYTSGSTGKPKGVAVTYGNLEHQFEMNRRVLNIGEKSVLVTWTPHYHDFCLISGIMQCIGGKSKMYLMSPADFIKSPEIWFKIIDRVRGTHIAAPNFAYEILANKVSDEQAASWDLSCIEIAMSAAEPIKSSTMDKFFAKFEASKFSRRAFCPSYGLAEHTVGVTLFGDDKIRVNKHMLESRGVCEIDETSDYQLWSCGRAMSGVDIKIVDSETLKLQPNLRVGEVWVNSPSKSPGYINKPELNRELVNAMFKNQKEGTEGYLRTGDLGFFKDGELFITGRLKDLIIVRGRNIAPHDIEGTVCKTSELLRPGKSIAFGINQDNGDEFVYIVAEQRSKVELSRSEYDTLAQSIRKSVANYHKLTPAFIGFLLPGKLPLSSSGKPQRRLCMKLFVESNPKLGIIASSDFGAEARAEQLKKPVLLPPPPPPPLPPALLPPVVKTFSEIERKVKEGFAKLAVAKRGRATHTHGVMGCGMMRTAGGLSVIPESVSKLLGRNPSVTIRHANIKGFADDAIIDGRGASLRVQLTNGKHQDIIMSTGKRFFRRSAASFYEWFIGKAAERKEICERDGEIAQIVSEIFCDPKCYTDVVYYSEVPLRLVGGKKTQLAQFRLRTAHATNQHVDKSDLLLPMDYIPRRDGDTRPSDYLKQQYREKLSGGCIDYELAIQLREEDAENIDMYDCTKEWDEVMYPFHAIGTVAISESVDEDLRCCFNVQCDDGFLAVPKTADAQHPSSLNQLRSIVYAFASEARLGKVNDQAAKQAGVLPSPLLKKSVCDSGTSDVAVADTRLKELIPSAGDTSPDAVTELFRDVGAKLASVHTDMKPTDFQQSVAEVLKTTFQQRGMDSHRAVSAVLERYNLKKVVADMVSEITVEQSEVPEELKPVLAASAANNLGWYNGTEREVQEQCMRNFSEVIPEPAWRTSSSIDKYGLILWSREDTQNYFKHLAFLDKPGIRTRMAASPYYLVRVSSNFAIILLRANTTANIGENQINDTVSPVTEYFFLLTKEEERKGGAWGLVGVYNSVGENVPNDTEDNVNNFVKKWVGFADARTEEERFANGVRNKMLAAMLLKELFSGIELVVDQSKPKPRSEVLAMKFREGRTKSMGLAADTKIAIIGAGPSGLTCAHELLKSGYTNVVVYEKDVRVAGKAGTFYEDDRPYDLGAHVVTTQHSTAHRRLQAMFGEYGVELTPVTPYYVYDTKAKLKLDIVPPQTEFEALTSKAEYRSVAGSREQGRAHRYIGGAASWLNERGLLDNAWNIPFVSSGYGFITDEIPATRIVKMAEMLNQTEGTLAQTPKHGFAQLWERVAAKLGPQNLHLGTAAREIRRSETGCEVDLSDGTTVSADRVILCCPPAHVSGLVKDQTRNERDIFSRVKDIKYFTTVCRIKNIPRLGFYLYNKECEVGSELDHVVSFHHRHEESDVYCLYSYGKPESGPQQILSTLHEDIKKIGGTVVETVLEPMEWSYGAHFKSEDLEMGMLDRYEGIQGLKNTYYSSCLGNFELIDCCVEYSTDLIERFFCKEKETPLWSVRADVLLSMLASDMRVSRATLEQSIKVQISEATGTPVGDVCLKSPLEVFGLDSITLFQLLGNMSRMLNTELSPQVIAEYPSFDAFLNSVYGGKKEQETKTLGAPGEQTTQARLDQLESVEEEEKDGNCLVPPETTSGTLRERLSNASASAEKCVALSEKMKLDTNYSMSAAVTHTSLRAMLSILIPERKQLQYPLSFEQERFWAASLLCGEDSSPMNVSLVFNVRGVVDVGLLRRSAWALYEKHDCLRTAVFVNRNGNPCQRVVDFEEVKEKIVKVETVERSRSAERVQEAQGKSFNLEEPPLWEVTLLKIANAEGESILNVTYHHIAGDGMAGGLFVKELIESYNNSKKNVGKVTVVNGGGGQGVSFGDYCSWQREACEEGRTEHTSYWEEYLSGATAVRLPTDVLSSLPAERTMGETSSNDSLFFDFPTDVTEAVRSCAKTNKVTPYVVMLSAFKLMLSNWTGSRDILVASPNSGRTNRQLEHVVGMTAFPMFLRTKLEPQLTASGLLEAVERTVADAQANQCNKLGQQTLPVSEISAILQRGNPTQVQKSENLIQVMFNYVGESSSTRKGLGVSGMDGEIEAVQNWKAGKPSGGMQFFWTSGIVDGVVKNAVLFDSELFSKATIQTVVANFKRLLSTLTSAGSTVVSNPAVSVNLAASFTADPILDSLNYWSQQLGQQSVLSTSIAPYNQICQQLLDPMSQLNEPKGKSVNVVLLRVEDLVRHSSSPAAVDVENVVGGLLSAFKHRRSASVETLVYILPSDASAQPVGLRDVVEAQNQRIVSDLSSDSSLHVFVENPLVGREGKTFDRISDEAGHIPYTDLYFTWLGTKVSRAVQSITREPFKVIILDCDNTLWEGVCGEGTMAVSAPFQEFQRKIRSCRRRGILLCLCSKNEEEDVVRAFEHPDMVLSLDDVVLLKVNWDRKSENVKKIASELNLGEDSFIFIDDNEVECEEMRANCPSVTTLQFPMSGSSCEEIVSFTNDTWLFDSSLRVSSVDESRTEMYRTESIRSAQRSETHSFEHFIKSLDLRVSYRRVSGGDVDVERVSQLTQRTNQFNTTTVRRTVEEVFQYLSREGNQCTLVEACDRFGDYGVVGALFYSLCAGNQLTVSSFMLSCRVLGRGVEHQVIAHLGREAASVGSSEVVLGVQKSTKNAPAMKFVEVLGDHFGTGLCVTANGFELRMPTEGCKLASYASISGGLIDDDCGNVNNDSSLVSPNSFSGHSFSRLNSLRAVSLQRRSVEDIFYSVQSIESTELLSPRTSSFSSSQEEPATDAERELQLELLELFAKVLKTKPECIRLTDNFFDLGGTSLHSVRLISAIRQRLDVALPLTVFGNTPTVKGLVDIIVAHRSGEMLRADSHDVDMDVKLDPEINTNKLSQIDVDITDPKTVLLTGATGFLGAFIAKLLLQKTSATIICLVRASDEKTGMDRIRSNFKLYNLWEDEMETRIEPLVGDLEKLRLGTSREQWDDLASRVDSIYHNGALLNFTFTYDRFKNANIRATEEVLRLATLSRLKPVHYVSTMAVFGSSEVMNCDFIDENHEMPSGKSVLGGYAQSKWVAEKLVRIGGERGIPVTVHRPGTITGDSRTGAWNVDDATARMVRSIMMLGMAPELDTNVEWLPVDFVAGWIVELSLNKANIGRTFHQVQGSVRPFSSMVAALGRYHCEDVQVVSFSEWRDAMQTAAASEDHPLHTLIPFFFDSSAGGKTLLETRLPEFRSSITQLALSHSFARPSQEELVRIYLSGLVEKDALNSDIVMF